MKRRCLACVWISWHKYNVWSFNRDFYYCQLHSTSEQKYEIDNKDLFCFRLSVGLRGWAVNITSTKMNSLRQLCNIKYYAQRMMANSYATSTDSSRNRSIVQDLKYRFRYAFFIHFVRHVPVHNQININPYL